MLLDFSSNKQTFLYGGEKVCVKEQRNVFYWSDYYLHFVQFLSDFGELCEGSLQKCTGRDPEIPPPAPFPVDECHHTGWPPWEGW